MVAYSLVMRSYKENSPVAMRAAVQGWGEAKKRVAEAEMEHARWEETNRITLRMEEVREVFGKWLGAIRNLMDAMPSSLASRANPSDPECAKRAIQEGIDQIFVTIQKAEGAFK
jgi:Sec-independent protein translocase protein TatA